MIYKQCVTLYNSKMYPNTKFWIPTANNIGDVPEVKFKMTPNQYGTLWHRNVYSQSQVGIAALKHYKIYALDTIFLELGPEDKVKISNPMTLCDPKVYPHTKFGIPVSNYITDMLRTQFRFRLTHLPAVCPACMELITFCGCKNVQNRQM